jgi:hypothetical protein
VHDSVIVVLLVVAWLVVLVPMLARHRQQVRRTADAALATRVLHRGDSGVALAARPGPAAGHPSDPGWVAQDELELEEETVDEQHAHEDDAHEDDAHEDDAHEDDAHEDVPERLEAEHAPLDGSQDHPGAENGHRTGRGGFDPRADAVARRARHVFRQRVSLVLLAVVVVTLLGALVGVGQLWWPHLLADLALVGYLAFLRRQTRIEEDVRERRQHRMGRARLGIEVDSEHAEQLGGVPRRLRRPGAVVLEIDDEDPAFDELGPPLAPAEMELPRASGQ